MRMRKFKSKWVTRNNLANWRRKSSVETVITNPVAGGDNKSGKGNPKDSLKSGSAGSIETEISFEALLNNLPLNAEKVNESNETIATNMIMLAKTYQNDLEEYQLAADTYEDYLKRFPDRLLDGEVYLNLHFCYTKLGNTQLANHYKILLNNKYANTVSVQKLNNPASLDPKTKNPEATKK